MSKFDRTNHLVANWSDAKKKEYINTCKAKAGHLLIGNVAQELCGAMEQAVTDFDKTRRRIQELCARIDANKQDNEAVQELNEIRIYSVQNFLLADANYASFFEIENLNESDVPYIEVTTRQEAAITIVSQDGGAPRWQPIVNQTKTQVLPFWLTSAEFEYPLQDEFSGQIADRSKSNIDIAYDLGMQLDGKLFGYLNALIGSFNVTGDLASRIYVPHSRIKTANLPTTNLLTPGDNTGSTLFRKSCMDAILAYCKAWGDRAFQDGALRPTAVFVPSAHITGFLQEIVLTNAANYYNAQVFEFGVIIDYGGQKWAFIADPTLDPAAKTAYVKMNKPIGKLWTKTSLDKVIVDNSPAMQKQNLESVVDRKVFFCGIPGPNRVNIAAVRYQT